MHESRAALSQGYNRRSGHINNSVIRCGSTLALLLSLFQRDSNLRFAPSHRLPVHARCCVRFQQFVSMKYDAAVITYRERVGLIARVCSLYFLATFHAQFLVSQKVIPGSRNARKLPQKQEIAQESFVSVRDWSVTSGKVSALFGWIGLFVQIHLFLLRLV